MPRRIFTPKDLKPLRRLTERVVEKQPDAALVAQAAQPFKRRIPKARHEELTEVRLPVEVETSTRPGGVPLHEIASAVRKEFPGVKGVSVTPGGLRLKFDKAPTAAERRKIDGLLGDRERLEAMKPVVREAPARGAEAALEAEAVPTEELEKVLRAPETSDTAWLRAFRSYTVKNLATGQPAKPRRTGRSGPTIEPGEE